MNRKTTPKVKDGKVHKKNRHTLTPSLWNSKQSEPVIDKEDPGDGYKHFLSKKDVLNFIELLPEWEELSIGLNAIVLSRNYSEDDAYCGSGGYILLCAWPRDKWCRYSKKYFTEHKEIFERLDVEYILENKLYLCKFNTNQIKAYQLLHLLLHELGHHHDRMTTKSQKNISRGEVYAEEYVRKYEKLIWSEYSRKFGI